MCDAREEGATFGYSYMRRGSQGMTSMRGWTRLTWHETGTWRKAEAGAVSRRLIYGRYADKQQPNENEREGEGGTQGGSFNCRSSETA